MTRKTVKAKNGNHESSSRPAFDAARLDAARQDLTDAALTPRYDPWREHAVRLLNEALATELTCVQRYRGHHLTAEGLELPTIAQEFLVHADQELAYAERIAARIAQLGGEPDSGLADLLKRSHADDDESPDLKAMIGVRLVAERIAGETYRQMIDLLKGTDSTTQRLLEDVFAQERITPTN